MSLGVYDVNFVEKTKTKIANNILRGPVYEGNI